ncbi:MarR family winged helix-turn-helix transcriptional regulator [Streptomyces sp. NPDC050161]|uniref:MarR family winged helix-turn-helix transcriptional regulator n=1 Tax=unclassified Streptomyces TaxID=2593676 RepID=UPI00371BEE9E
MPEPASDQDPIVALQRVLATVSYLLTRSQAHEQLAMRAGVKAGRSDLWLLMALDGSGGVSRVGDLAALLMVEPSHVTRQISRLESQDLVARTPDPADRRARQVVISPHGKAVLERLQDARRAGLHQALEGLDDHAVATTVDVLNRLVQHVRERDAEQE